MFEKVAQLISDHMNIPVSDIQLESDIIRDLELSSFDVMDLVARCESEFGVNIPDRKIKYMATVGDVVDYLQNRM